MARSRAACLLWHDLDRVLKSALSCGASFDEAAGALNDKVKELRRLEEAGRAPADFRRGERL